MKVIFLDVDGVLNSEVSRELDREKFDNWMECEVSEMHVNNLKRIVDETGAKIVLSSSWRYDFPQISGRQVISDPLTMVLVRKLRDAGLEIFDVTPDLHGKMRGLEVQEWLNNHPEVKRYVILDDDSDFTEEQKAFFVNSTFKSGLTDVLSDKAVSILNA